MSKLRIGAILFLVLIFSLMLTSCNSTGGNQIQSSSPTNILSTSYPVDIVGTVIIAHHEIKNGKVLDSVEPQKQLWIVRFSVRNKSQDSVAGSNYWYILPKGSTGTIDRNMVLYPSNFTNFTILQGQTGLLTAEYFVPAGLNPNDYQITYIGSSPQSIGNLSYDGQEVNYYNWDTQSILASYTTPTQTFPVVTQTSVVTWNHTGYISSTMQGYGTGSYSSITFQDGFSLTFIATAGAYTAPSIGGKFKVTYFYNAQMGGNVITSLLPVR